MIDIEPEVFTANAKRLREEFPGIVILGESLLVPSSFPAVVIEEADNYPVRATQDSESYENHARLMYEVNVFSNKKNGNKKTECRKIFRVIDEVMTGLGFTRTMMNPIEMADPTLCRILGRYSGIVSKENYVFRG